MSPARYSRAAIFLHWTIALALAFQLSLGWRLEDVPNGPAGFWFYQLHKSIGITILALSLARLVIRFTVRRPAPEGDEIWARRLADAVHAGLYVFMIGGPLTGWMLVSTAKIQVPTLIFGAIPLPHLPLGRAMHEPAETAHSLLAWLGVALFALHVLGALRHQFMKREPLIERMLTKSRLSFGGATFAFVAALGLIFGALATAKMIEAPAATPSVVVPAAAPAPEPEVAAPEASPAEAANVREPAAAAEPGEVPAWAIAPGGRLGFTANWTGQAIMGAFSRWTGDIRFDPAALDRSTIKVTVDLASAATADAQRDEMLQGDDFFATAAHPKAIFTSSSVTSLGGDRYEARGALDLKGVKKSVRLPFTLTIKGADATVKGSATIDRTAFAVGAGEWTATDQIAGPVAIDFAFSARRKD